MELDRSENETNASQQNAASLNGLNDRFRFTPCCAELHGVSLQA
jgi:hypothetical protein